MKKPKFRIIVLCLLCIAAAGANYLLSNLSLHYMKIPLYIDTLFVAAVTFSAGLIPGLITALLPGVLFAFVIGSLNPFLLCSIAEVFIIYLLKPAYAGKEHALSRAVRIFARLMMIYIICAIAISILGGVIDFIYYDVMMVPNEFFNVEDTFKIGLLDSGIPLLIINIVSRIPVNIVDRFIVVFGGYGVSLGIGKLLRFTVFERMKI